MSWLNVVGQFFRDITNRRIRRGAFPSVRHFNDSIDPCIEQRKLEPTPCIWAAYADDILVRVTRARVPSSKMDLVSVGVLILLELQGLGM
ncbi:MAG: hypothetical protein AAF196_17260, partial [Planctomycetota bacterium]